MIPIAFLIDRLTRGGTETQLLALIRSLDRRKFRPSLVLLDGSDAESRELEPIDCPVLRLGLKSLHRPAALKAAGKLAGFWRAEQARIVQAYFLDSVYFGVPLARSLGIRRVIRVRNNMGHWLTTRHRLLGKVMARLVDVTLTNCEPARQAILAAEGGDASKVIVLENGVDLERFTRLAPPSFGPQPRIGVVANLRPVKGIDLFIRSAERLKARFPRATFHVAGEGEDRPRLQRLIAETGLVDRFHLLGGVADVPGFLASLDAVVLPSRAEGMSNALLEALASGRPVVATDVGANAHLLGDGAFGQLVAPEDPESLAQTIAAILDDPRAALALARSGQRHVQATYSRDAMRERFEQFYERIAA